MCHPVFSSIEVIVLRQSNAAEIKLHKQSPISAQLGNLFNISTASAPSEVTKRIISSFHFSAIDIVFALFPGRLLLKIACR